LFELDVEGANLIKLPIRKLKHGQRFVIMSTTTTRKNVTVVDSGKVFTLIM
jgi:hypothetical protein